MVGIFGEVCGNFSGESCYYLYGGFDVCGDVG